MANSKLLKEAIADAKAVKETALANAKLALEEAFTPRLQSILSKKLREEEGAEEEEGAQMTPPMKEELSSSEIGSGNEKTPKANKPLSADTDLSVGVKKSSAKAGAENKDYKKVADISEGEGAYGDEESTEEPAMENLSVSQLREKLQKRLSELDAMSAPDAMDGEEEEVPAIGDAPAAPAMEADMADDSEISGIEGSEEEQPTAERMDLEAIIKELEDEMESDDDEDEDEEDEEDDDDDAEMEAPAAPAMEGEEVPTTDTEETDEVIDLEEILKEMEADLKREGEGEEEVPAEELAETKKQLKEAISTIESLRKTLNEVNLLNAKLLFANKLFRAHNMTNEQKVKIIETLDRTKSVREVKLVYSTLAENLRYGANKSAKKSITEGLASKVVKSTKPAAEKQVISEAVDFSSRFKKLAGIIK